jgi:hypothetical protein
MGTGKRIPSIKALHTIYWGTMVMAQQGLYKKEKSQLS